LVRLGSEQNFFDRQTRFTDKPACTYVLTNVAKRVTSSHCKTKLIADCVQGRINCVQVSWLHAGANP